MSRIPPGPLRSGWTTGACAAAAAGAAYRAAVTGVFPDAASVLLPGGQAPVFALAWCGRGAGWAGAGIVKDAGDDPDVTHGALIIARVTPGGAGLRFVAGEGVGMVTRPGLPIPPGEPAINPVPRRLIDECIAAAAVETGGPPGALVEIAVPGGAAIAQRTWNPRLGITGGISILGTTGIVRPFSCAAWIASIHRGVDVARASGFAHVIAATGSTSEKAARAIHDVPDEAMLDMGDFAGGLLKYLARHPLPRLTIAGGFAKLLKLSQGAVDLHSDRSQVDFDRLAALVAALGGDAAHAAAANTAKQVLDREGPALAQAVAEGARGAALALLRGAPVAVEVMVTDRAGAVLGRAS